MAPELEYYGTAGLQRWLASSDRDPKQFVRWLQDYDIPGDREGREPHEWLLEQLGVGTSRAENEGRMAEALAEFIESEPDRSPPGDDPDQLMYNLFHLAAGLRRPRILGKPLLAIYRRRSPTGAYLQISHLRSLQEALAENQIDSSLKEEWMKLIRDETYSPLDADRGFESILRMPESEETLERVNREAIGEALKWMAIRMEDYERSDRAQQFSLLIRRVKSYYSLSFDVLTDYVLFRLSVRFDWPPWACEYVPIPSEHLVRLRNGGGVVPPPMLFLDFPLEMIKALLSLQWPADITTQPVEALFVHEALIVLVERGVDRVGASQSRSAQVGDIVEILIVLRGVAKLKGDWVLYAATIHAQREIAFVGMGDLASEFRRAHMPSEIIECLAGISEWLGSWPFGEDPGEGIPMTHDFQTSFTSTCPSGT